MYRHAHAYTVSAQRHKKQVQPHNRTLRHTHLNFNDDNAIIDTDGRFTIIKISVYNISFCIANIYGPNAGSLRYRGHPGALGLSPAAAWV